MFPTGSLAGAWKCNLTGFSFSPRTSKHCVSAFFLHCVWCRNPLSLLLSWFLCAYCDPSLWLPARFSIVVGLEPLRVLCVLRESFCPVLVPGVHGALGSRVYGFIRCGESLATLQGLSSRMLCCVWPFSWLVTDFSLWASSALLSHVIASPTPAFSSAGESTVAFPFSALSSQILHFLSQ